MTDYRDRLQSNKEKGKKRERERNWEIDIIYIWTAFYKNSRWADLICAWAGEAEWFWWYAGWITLWFLDLSKCMVRLAKGTHISPTSDPRKLWVGVGFQMATQSYHCAPVNTMKTKLTHCWHSTPPTLPNLDFQHNSGGKEKLIIRQYRNLKRAERKRNTTAYCW